MKSRAQRYRYVRHVVSGTRPSPWSPLSLGSSLAAWYKADAGCYTDAACLFAAASSQYLSRTGSAALRGGTTWWRSGFLYLTDTGTKRVLQSCLSGNDGYQVEVTAGDVLKVTAGTGAATASATHGTALSATTWYFWYAYFDGTNIGISLNGGAAVTQALGAAYSAGTASFFVGSDPTPANYMNGALARNYGGNGTLAAGSITALYAAGAGLFYADLGATLTAAVASGFALNLCESSGDRVESVGALNLTPTNGPTVAAGPGEGLAVSLAPVKRRVDYGTQAINAVQATIDNQPTLAVDVRGSRDAILYDGTNDLMVAANAVPAIGTGDFTVASRIKTRTLAVDYKLVWRFGADLGLYINNDKLNLYVAGVGDNLFTLTVAQNTEYALVVVRSGGTVTLYVAGVADATTPAVNKSVSAGDLQFGCESSGFNASTHYDFEQIFMARAATSIEVASMSAYLTAA